MSSDNGAAAKPAGSVNEVHDASTDTKTETKSYKNARARMKAFCFQWYRAFALGDYSRLDCDFTGLSPEERVLGREILFGDESKDLEKDKLAEEILTGNQALYLLVSGKHDSYPSDRERDCVLDAALVKSCVHFFSQKSAEDKRIVACLLKSYKIFLAYNAVGVCDKSILYPEGYDEPVIMLLFGTSDEKKVYAHAMEAYLAEREKELVESSEAALLALSTPKSLEALTTDQLCDKALAKEVDADSLEGL